MTISGKHRGAGTLASGLCAALLLSVACSGKDSGGGKAGDKGAGGSNDGIFQPAGGASGKGSNGEGGAAGGGGDTAFPTCEPAADDQGCIGEIYQGETIPLDIYVMFDQSGSMLNEEEGGITRMDAVRTAVGEFLRAPSSVGMSVGIGYFGQQAIGQTTCDQAAYEEPGVTVGPLPGNADALIESLAGREPTGETPSGAAIRGACTYAKQWKTDHPEREVVILLVTDGEPKAPVTCGEAGDGPCCPSLDDAVQATTDCRGSDPALRTFVLGVGPFLDNLGQIAAAGGTDKAYLVSGGDVSQKVLAALNSIRIAAQIPCELNIPPSPIGATIDPNLVSLVRTSGVCETEAIPYRAAEASCDAAAGGWYYDDPLAPAKVLLCGKTCELVSLPGERLSFSVGCTREDPR